MVYVGSYGADGLRTARIGPAGELVITGTHPVPDASWLAVRDGRLYATNERDEGSITVLDPQTLAVLAVLPSHGAAPTHLDVVGGHVLVANHGSGVVVLAPDGSVSDDVPGVRAHQVLTDPSGAWVIAVFLGTDTIDVCRLVDGHLLRHRRLTAGPGPRHLVWCGDRAFVVLENAPSVLVCSWDAGHGELAVVDEAGTGEPGDYPGEGVLSADHRFLHVTNRGSNTITTFHVGERLRRIGTVSCGGDWPRHAALGPGEDRLYVANQRSGTVTWLPRDPATGTLSAPIGETKVDAVAMVCFG